MEAEYVAVSLALKLTLAIRNVIIEMGFKFNIPITIYEDNQACIAIAWNPESSNRSKHIDIRYHFIRERIKKGIINLQYCPTNEMKPDLLTKALEAPAFIKIRKLMNVI